ncbi:MAG: TetR family transcriptional regulator [Rhizobiales bacterium PAR1]|nr:MAG: TetR family transcriptional regulator [Rhizobiales bacterium PAR1]
MSKVAVRRESQREALIEAAERRIAFHSVAGLKARDLAGEVGVALGAIYNLVEDMDELVLRVISRTLARLDAALSDGEVTARSSAEAVDRLVVIATRYHAFAAGNLHLWRVMFEYRMAPDRVLPEWAVADQMRLFRHIIAPLAVLMPEAALAQREVMARTLFAAVHGIIALGLDEKLVAVPLEVLDRQLEWLVRSTCTEAALKRAAGA